MEVDLEPIPLAQMVVADIKDIKIGDAYKKTNKFIKAIQSEGGNLNRFKNSCNDRDLFESSVKLMVVDSTQSEVDLVKVLKDGDKAQVKRSMKCGWFFTTGSPQFFQHNILPNVSLSARCKVINALGKYVEIAENAEKLHQIVLKEYGRKTAEVLIPRCTEAYAVNYYKTEVDVKRSIGERNLIETFKRYPASCPIIVQNFLDLYETTKDSNFNCFSKTILKYLATHHSNYFIEFYALRHQQLPYMSFGIKLTQTLVGKFKPQILQLSTKYYDLLHTKTFLSMLNKEELIQLHVDIYHDNYEEMENWPIFEGSFLYSKLYSGYISKQIVPDVVNAIFFKLFNEHLSDHPEYWNENLLKVLPVETRVKYAEEMFKEGEEEEDESYIYLLDCEKAFNILKKLIMKCPESQKRSRYVSFMVQACSLNMNVKIFIEVCKYVMERLRNDKVVIDDLISSFAIYKQLLHQLDDDQWKVVDDLLFMCVQMIDYSGYTALNILQSRILYKLAAKQNVEADVVKYNEMEVTVCSEISFTPRDEHSLLPKHFILELGEQVKSKKENTILDYFCIVVRWNEKNPKDKIKFEEILWITEIIEKIINDEDQHRLVVKIVNVISSDRELKVKYYPMIMKNHFIKSVYFYLARHYPELIKDCIGVAVQKNSISKSMVERRCLKQLYLVGLIDHLKKLMIHPKYDKSNQSHIYLLSHILTIQEFQTVFNKYFPTSLTIDYRNSKYEIVQYIPAVLKNIRPVKGIFDLMLKYLGGDYLKLVLSTLLYFCSNVSTGRVIDLVKEHCNKPVSVKKNLLRCLADQMSLTERMEYFHQLWKTENHYSIKTLIFNKITACYLNNKSEKNWRIVAECIEESDELTYTCKPAITDIENAFLNEYIQLLWTLSFKNEKLKPIKQEVICGIQYHMMPFIDQEFCLSRVTEMLFTDKADPYIIPFAIDFMRHRVSVNNMNFDFLKKLIATNRKKTTTISSFIDSVISKVVNSKDDTSLIKILTAICEEIYKEEEFFAPLLCLTFTLLYMSNKTEDKNDKSYEFGKQLFNLLTEWELTKNSVELYNFVAEILRGSHISSCIEHIYLVKGILEYEPKSRNSYLFAYEVLTSKYCHSWSKLGPIKTLFCQIIQTFLKSGDKRLTMLTHNYLMKINICIDDILAEPNDEMIE